MDNGLVRLGCCKFLIGIIIVVSLSSLSASSLGVTPTEVNYGQLEDGESYEFSVFVTSRGVDEEYLIEPEVGSATPGNLFDSVTEEERISERGVSDWIEFSQQQYSVDPNTTIEGDIQGQPMSGDEQVDFNVEVPDGAEPGIHKGTVRMNPQFDLGEGASTRTIGEAVFRFSFEVSGGGIRDLSLVSLNVLRQDEDEARVVKRIRNAGTVTASFDDSNLTIYDPSHNELERLSVSSERISPGETREFETTWRSDESIEEGEYQIEGEIDYITGQAFASDTFRLPEFDVIEIDPGEEVDDVSESSYNLPYWLVLMVLVILGVLMWSFEIDPLWIFGIVGFLGVSSFIFLSSISNYLIIFLILGVSVVLLH